MRFGMLAIGSVLCCGVSPVAAQGPGDQVFTLRGACSLMRLGSNDLTKNCVGKLVSFTMANGRVGFMFMFGEGLLQFSGDGPKQTRLPGQQSSQPIDRVRFTLTETAPDQARSQAATGTCVYGNFFNGTAKVTCRVKSGAMSFAADFVSDGSPPSSVNE